MSATEPAQYPFNKVAGTNLAPEYARARSTGGLTRVRMPRGEPGWLVTRYADARLVLSDRRFSRGAALNRDAPRISPELAPGLVSMDPPNLARVRTLAVKAFTARRVERLRPRVRELATDLVDKMVATGPPADLVRDFALPIPITMICELLGVPVADQPRFRAWNEALLASGQLTDEESRQNYTDLSTYIRELIQIRRAEPADDLLSALVEARDSEAKLSERELVELCITILVGGYDTLASEIPNFVYTLLDHPTEYARLRADPALVDSAVEELLRFVPLAVCAMFPHYATEDVQIGDAMVCTGEPVLVSVGSANHDEHRFTSPDELDFDREAPAHLAFGHGMHHCIGAALARIELQESLRVLVTRLPGLRLAGEVEWKTETFIRGPRVMPITW